MYVRKCALSWGIVLGVLGCGIDESQDPPPVPRKVKRERQAKFAPDDFTFAKLQVADGEADGLFGTCLHITMRDANNALFDCELAITLPIHVQRERWPRDEDDAAQYAARAANAVRKHLKTFKHADAFSCRAYAKQMEAYLGQRRPKARTRWQGADITLCDFFKDERLPHFNFSGGHLLVGDYREWSKRAVE
jgi:hypothetical protein